MQGSYEHSGVAGSLSSCDWRGVSFPDTRAGWSTTSHPDITTILTFHDLDSCKAMHKTPPNCFLNSELFSYANEGKRISRQYLKIDLAAYSHWQRQLWSNACRKGLNISMTTPTRSGMELVKCVSRRASRLGPGRGKATSLGGTRLHGLEWILNWRSRIKRSISCPRRRHSKREVKSKVKSKVKIHISRSFLCLNTTYMQLPRQSSHRPLLRASLIKYGGEVPFIHGWQGYESIHLSQIISPT